MTPGKSLAVCMYSWNKAEEGPVEADGDRSCRAGLTRFFASGIHKYDQ